MKLNSYLRKGKFSKLYAYCNNVENGNIYNGSYAVIFMKVSRTV